MANCKIYRFKFSDDVTELLADFAKLHLFDSRDQLKTCFEELWVENEEVFKNDEKRLTQLGMDGGYDGYKTRVFRSMKYYHIKKIKRETGNKSVQSVQSVNEPEEKKKEKRHRFSKSLIEAVESSILKEMEENVSFKPSLHITTLFETPEFKILLQEEQRRFRIMEQDQINEKNETGKAEYNEQNDSEFITNFNARLKKLYQNRYFNISSKVL